MRTADAIVVVLPALVDAGPDTLRQWLRRKHFQVHTPPTGHRAVLYVADAPRLTAAFRRDFVACAATSFECAVEAIRAPRNLAALAWPSVKLYYAAFFSAHAIMRLFQTSSFWAEPQDAAAVQEVADLWGYSGSNKPARGAWTFSFDDKTSEVTISSGQRIGGSHEALWKSFADALEQIAQRVAQSPALLPTDAQQVIRRLYGLRDLARSSTLPQTRGEINYQRGRGLWYPYSISDKDATIAQTDLRDWTKDVDAILDGLATTPGAVSFAKATSAVVGLLRDVSELLVERFGNTSRDIVEWPLRYLTQCRHIVTKRIAA